MLLSRKLVDVNKDGFVDGNDRIETRLFRHHEKKSVVRQQKVSDFLNSKNHSAWYKFNALTYYANESSMGCSIFRSIYLLLKYS